MEWRKATVTESESAPSQVRRERSLTWTRAAVQNPPPRLQRTISELDRVREEQEEKNKSIRRRTKYIEAEELCEASRKGNLSIVKEKIVWYGTIDGKGRNALFYACLYGNVECAREILQASFRNPVIKIRCGVPPKIPQMEDDSCAVSLSQAILQCPTIFVKSLEMTGLHIGDRGAVSLAESLLQIAFVKSLNLANNFIGDRGAAAFAKVLFKNDSLTSLNLSDNRIGEIGIKALRTSLHSNNTLTDLNLKFNKFPADSLQPILNRNYLLANVHAIESCQRYDIVAKGRNVDREDLNLLCKHLTPAVLSNISQLTLSENILDDEAIEILAPYLTTSRSLVLLDLNSNHFGDRGAQALADLLMKNTPLQHLWLGSNNIQNEGAKALGRSLRYNKHLEELDLWNNSIGDTGAIALAKGIRKNELLGLTSISLDFNKLTKQGKSQISDAALARSVNCDLVTIEKKITRGLRLKPLDLSSREIRVALLGGGGIGAKSSLVIQYVFHQFRESYDPTVEDTYKKQVVIDKELVMIEFLDTAGKLFYYHLREGQEEYKAMRDEYFKSCNAFILGYSITSHTSFDEVINLHNELLRINEVDDYPKILIGNKSDLESSRQVSTAEGLELSKKLGCPFFETSAKTRHNVEECIAELVREVWRFDASRNKPTFPFASEKRHRSETRKTEKSQFQQIVREELEASMETDAAKLLRQYMTGFESALGRIQKPNVLIAGPSGAGKSSLVNAVFGKSMSQTAVGLPVTQSFTLYAPEDKTLRVFDSKGAEMGEQQGQDFVREVKEFLYAMSINGDIGHQIHVVWYVLNAATSRFTEADIEYCNLFVRPSGEKIPVLILLNHSDKIEKSQLEELQQVVEASKSSNCAGIFSTIAVPEKDVLVNIPDSCPVCGCEGFVRKRIFICDTNDHQTNLVPPNGLTEVVQATMSLLPNAVKDCFMQSQVLALSEKEKRCNEIICNYMQQVAMENFVRKRTICVKVGEMLASIARVWDFALDSTKLDKKIYKELHLSAMSAVTQLFKGRMVNPPLFGAVGFLWSYHLGKCAKATLTSALVHQSVSLLDMSKALGDASKSFSLTPSIVSVLEGMKDYQPGTKSMQQTFSAIQMIVENRLNNLNDDENQSKESNKRKEQEVLVEQLIDSMLSKEDDKSRQEFVSKYPREVPLLEPLFIFDSLVFRFPKETDSSLTSEQQSMRLKICTTVLAWMELRWEDFLDETMSQHLAQFIHLVRSSGLTQPGDRLASVIASRVEVQSKRRGTRAKEAPYILSFPPSLVAQILTQIDFSIFRSVSAPVMISAEPPEALEALWEHPRSISNWTTTTVLQERSTDHRLKLVQFFIDLATEMETLNNFQGVYNIINGLTQPSVTRLNKTWAKLPKEYRLNLKQFESMCSPTGGTYYSLYCRIANSKPPCVPQWEGLRNFMGSKLAGCSEEEYKLWGRKFEEEINLFQKNPYPPIKAKTETLQELVSYFESLPSSTIGQDDLYFRSCLLESNSTTSLP